MHKTSSREVKAREFDFVTELSSGGLDVVDLFLAPPPPPLSQSN